MSLHHFSKDFAKQFRYECGLYSPTQEHQCGNLLVKKINGSDAEMVIIGERLTEKFFNEQLVHQIILTLKNNDFPAAGRLLHKAIGLRNECEAYLLQEPYTSPYYKEHVSMLHSFAELIQAFTVDFNENVYDQLRQYHTELLNLKDCLLAESSSLTDILEATEYYQAHILAFYNHFIDTWQAETNNNDSNGKGSVQLTTHMADQLQALLVHTEEILACLENTLALLLTWEDEMDMKELQEIYN